MKTNSLYLFVILTALFACNEENQAPTGEFAHGVFIINEGNFSESNGSVGFYNETSEMAESDVFEKANGVAPGGIIQSVYFYQNMAFIIDQLGSKIHVVNAETFESITTIEAGLSTPRYMVVTEGKAFITNWGPFDSNYDLPASYVSVIDLETFEELSSIETDKGPEGIIVLGGMVYVANSFSNTIDVINPISETIEAQITVWDGPLSMQVDMNGKLWVISTSYVSGSALTQFDVATEEIIKMFPVRSGARTLDTNGERSKLYYLAAPYGSDAVVVELSISATEDAAEALITSPNLYGLGVHPESGIIFLGNHNAFQGNGTVLRYEGDQLLSTFATGVGPNGFVFR